jgi:peroxin-19
VDAGKSIPGLGSTNLDPTDEAEEELDFAQELAKEMENLMHELSTEAEGCSTKTDDGEPLDPSAENARALWEKMLVEGMDGNPGTSQSSGNGDGFQDRIKQAVNKLKESESNLQVQSSFLFLCFQSSLTKILQ